jgi:hypothetical protein
MLSQNCLPFLTGMHFLRVSLKNATDESVKSPIHRNKERHLMVIIKYNLRTKSLCAETIHPYVLRISLKKEERSRKPVLRIHDILGWIRIRGSMPLTNGSGSESGFGSGSCYFRH